MKTIFRYPLTLGFTELRMPAGANVLSVQMQRGRPQLWALVESSHPDELRAFDIYGTGHRLPESPGTHVATIQDDNGALIWHVVESQRVAA